MPVMPVNLDGSARLDTRDKGPIEVWRGENIDKVEMGMTYELKNKDEIQLARNISAVYVVFIFVCTACLLYYSPVSSGGH